MSLEEAHGVALQDKLMGGIPLSFTDMVGRDEWEQEAVEGARAAGLMRGYPDGTFAPDQPIRRVEVAAALLRLYRALTTHTSVPTPLSERDLWQKVAPSVCYCETATAFCVAPGILCTDWHVVQGGAPQVSTLQAPKTHVYADWVPGAHDALLDFALVRDPSGLPPLPLATAAPQAGDVCWCFGAGAGQALTMVRLIVGLEELNVFPDSGSQQPRRIVVCSGGIQGGDSGGAVVNARGELVGPMLAAWGGGTRCGIAPLDVFRGWLTGNLPKI